MWIIKLLTKKTGQLCETAKMVIIIQLSMLCFPLDDISFEQW